MVLSLALLIEPDDHLDSVNPSHYPRDNCPCSARFGTKPTDTIVMSRRSRSDGGYSDYDRYESFNAGDRYFRLERSNGEITTPQWECLEVLHDLEVA